MNSFINKLKANPYLTFFFDGAGAFVSAVLLLTVVRRMEVFFGMPSQIVLLLGLTACVLMIFSFSCYLFRPKRWHFFLHIISIANGIYACITTVLLFKYVHQLTAFGFAYFIIEILILLVFIIIEQRVAASSKPV
jgi:hypothetical protein